MRSSRPRAIACAIIVLMAGTATACSPPTTDIDTAEMMFDLSDALNDVRQDNAILQDQLDSLRIAVARQDTVIARLAQVAGVPLQ